ncbi:MAG: glycine cleavage system aminomethyltransferase GcvT [Firmicutes bacterium]|nr:glycine cleavage system aminomethyltransferase GcvT [Bacillota bacterium]
MAVGNGAQKTPLYEAHRGLGARIVEYAGWLMPVQYSGVLEEHKTVREKAGIFDLSHMGEIRISGSKAHDFLQGCTTNDLERLEVGQIQYSLLCNEEGGIVDDILIYRHPWGYELVVNAANKDKDLRWLRRHRPERGVVIDDVSNETALIAVQGPASEEILVKTLGPEIAELRYYTFMMSSYQGKQIMISRTGYTGEDGFEIYLPPAVATMLWKRIMAFGKEDLIPVGLGARDTLRLEMGYCLYGNDISERTNPLEAGLGWIVKLDKDFIGRDAIAAIKESGVTRKLVAITIPPQVEGRRAGIPRMGYPVYVGDTLVGEVTSGTWSPTLQQPICLAYVPAEYSQEGQQLEIEVRRTRMPGTVVKKPFVQPRVKR